MAYNKNMTEHVESSKYFYIRGGNYSKNITIL